MQQREEKQLEAGLDALIVRVKDLRDSIHAFLMKLEHEHQTLQWTSVLDSFALLSGQLSTLQKLVMKEKMPSLQNLIFLPLVLSPDSDPQLETTTEGRVPVFSHEVVPDYLRTKFEPEVETREKTLTTQSERLTPEAAQKQIQQLNNLCDKLLNKLNAASEDWDSEVSASQGSTPASSLADTSALIAAVSFGKGLKPSRTPSQSGPDTPQSQPSPQASQAGPAPGKAPSTIKTNIRTGASSHPYQR
ncbi:mediator of RNA polymerase II transcription subunit 8 [Branchiostoma belcheri]|nr:mediator of RNA polymerase II transcription subunit 8 [Branchiostoma belcheri]